MDASGDTNVGDLLTPAGPPATPRAAQPMYLIVLSGGIPGAMLRLGPAGTRLGRAPDNDLQLPDGNISRHHAFLRADGRDVLLTDLGSTNGTYVNGRRLPPHTATAIHDGDRIGFGPSVVVKFARPDPCEEQFQRELFERSVRDALTGLFNRRYFLDQAPQLAERTARIGRGLAVMMLDVDHFKRINDAFGHATGDVVLREVAAVIRRATRAEDLVARYGGEEFVIALPIAAPDQATERAERIRRTLAARRISVAGSETVLRVTASIGLAVAPAGHPRPVANLVAAADGCLYQAKDAGRNRVVACGKDPLALAPESPTTFDGGK